MDHLASLQHVLSMSQFLLVTHQESREFLPLKLELVAHLLDFISELVLSVFSDVGVVLGFLNHSGVLINHLLLLFL